MLEIEHVPTALNLINPGGGAGAGAAIDFYDYVGNAQFTPEAQFTSVGDGNFSAGFAFKSKEVGNAVGALITRTSISSTGIISTAGNITSAGNVQALNFIGNFSGNINAVDISASGNVTGGNLNAAGLSLSGNVISALNMVTAITTTGNITGGNISATGNINIAGQLAATVADATALAIALG